MMHIKHDSLNYAAQTSCMNHTSKSNFSTHMSYSNHRYDSLGWVRRAEWKFLPDSLMEDGVRVKPDEEAQKRIRNDWKMHFA